MSVSISKPLLAVIKNSLAELFSHSQLVNLFETYDFSQRQGSLITNKLTKTAAYLDHQDWSNAQTVSKILELLTQTYSEFGHLVALGKTGVTNNSIFAMSKLHETLENNGIKWSGKNYVLLNVSQIGTVDVFNDFDSKHIHTEVERARENIEKDPADAMTAAENIFVATCKKILSDEGLKWGTSDSPMQMLNHVLKTLNILPEDISSESKGSDSAKKTIRSMGAAIQGLSELRNLYGDSHGKAPTFKGLEARHARLLVGLAESLSIFLAETHAKLKNSK